MEIRRTLSLRSTVQIPPPGSNNNKTHKGISPGTYLSLRKSPTTTYNTHKPRAGASHRPRERGTFIPGGLGSDLTSSLKAKFRVKGQSPAKPTKQEEKLGKFCCHKTQKLEKKSDWRSYLNSEGKIWGICHTYLYFGGKN